MSVRPARADEIPAVVAAYDWLFAPPGGPAAGWDEAVAAERVRATMEDERSTVLVADDLAGFCTVYLDIVSVRFGRRAWVEDLAVDPERRSQGLGKALLDAARSWAAGRGADYLELTSGDARTDAHRFYVRERPSATSRAFRFPL